MLAKINSSTVFGLQSFLIEIEIDSSGGLPGTTIVGLPDTAVKESKERIYSAIRNSGYQNPVRKFTINLAPANISKKGALFDLPIAIGILVASSQVKNDHLNEIAILGELALDGSVRKVNGVLPMCLKLKKEKINTVILPADNAPEGALVKDLDIIPIINIKEAIDYLNHDKKISPFKVDLDKLFSEKTDYEHDFSDIKGQTQAKRALEISAAGGHNLLMIGSPGAGKTMLARTIPSILPGLQIDEALEITKLYSVSGLLADSQSLITKRIFRAPHHTISHVGLIGGGSIPKPGEVSLSHLGILFLDEFPEFNRTSLEVLRQPMEDGYVTISRALASITYPARFTLIAAMNPCPCGNYLDPTRECTCTPYQVQHYWSKLSGPLLDRIDLHLEIPRLNDEDLTKYPQGESSYKIRKRVIIAREIQTKRFADSSTFTNSQMSPSTIRKYCQLGEATSDLLYQANKKYCFSGRSYDRILKVARTIADLENTTDIQKHHLAEALQYKAFKSHQLK